MTRPRLILVGGGVRSGKSAFALQRARELGRRRTFIATAQAFDDEMRLRIDRHRVERGAEFDTIEEPTALIAALDRVASEVVVIDCLTLWLSNLLMVEPVQPLEALEVAVDQLAEALERRRQHIVVVTNEVGMGVVPESALGRLFRDLAGRTHQRVGKVADEVYVGVLGCILRLRPGPVALVGGAE